MRRITLRVTLLCAAALAATASPALAAANGGVTSNGGSNTAQFSPGEITGGAPIAPPDTVAPNNGGTDTTTPPAAPAPQTAHVATLAHGIAHAPTGAPAAVVAAIAAANRLRHKPYIWGGGHASFHARGYDCSGSVSYVLHAAGLLGFPEVSGALAHWGVRGSGKWITVYANAGHAYMMIAGLRFDTSGEGQSGPRWRPEPRWERHGFHARHYAGL